MNTQEKLQHLKNETHANYDRVKAALEASQFNYEEAKRKLLQENENLAENTGFSLMGFVQTLVSIRKGERNFASVPLPLLLVLIIWKPIILLPMLIVLPLLGVDLDAWGPYEVTTNKVIEKLNLLRLDIHRPSEK